MDRQDGTQAIVAIYALLDPRSDIVRYVGQTRGTLERRLMGHLHEARDGRSSNAGKREWIRGLLYAGLGPTIELLEEVSADEADAAEARWIHTLRTNGADLLNVGPLRRMRRAPVKERAEGGPASGLLTVAEAATALGIHPSRMRHMIRDGLIPATKYGRDLYIQGAALQGVMRRPMGRPPGGAGPPRPSAAELACWRAAYREEYGGQVIPPFRVSPVYPK